jgi:hypothetical protein
LLVYSNASANTTFGSPAPGEEPLNCRGIDIVEVPLDNPANASYLNFLPSGDPAEPVAEHHACHDSAVILGSVMKAACSGGNSLTIWSLDPAEGGSLEEPMFMHHTEFPGVTVGHTASFTWDGKYAIFGHEPGGGSQARCQATSNLVDRTLFFVEVETGDVAGTIVHPRPQTNLENCTWHNLNVVPTDKGYILVAGNYQSGSPWSTSPTRRTPMRSRTPIRHRSSIPTRPLGSSSAATGPRTGTTASSTSLTSPAGSSSGT